MAYSKICDSVKVQAWKTRVMDYIKELDLYSFFQ